MTSTDSFSVEFDDDTEVLLLLRKRNRELFAKWLGEGLTVLPEADDLPETFDICILDAAAFAAYRDTLAGRKADAAPVFLPYLLVVREGNRPYLDAGVRELVDEIIVIPATPAEFAIRLQSLLNARNQSVLLRDQKAREIEQLARQNEQLEEFASIVSHDLRNPLSVISGAIGLTEQTGDLAHLELANNGVRRMGELIDGLLELARQGQSVGETTAVDVGAVARKAWGVVDASDAALVVAGDQTVEADTERLQALFENLFRNSVEHGSTSNRSAGRSGDSVEHGSTSSRDGRSRPDDSVEHGSTGEPGDDDSSVTITVGPLGAGRVGFYVADDGPGISEAEREQVLEHGYTTEPGGTGLGLSIVRSIADAHGWTITITERDSGGARFEIDCEAQPDERVSEPLPE
ncbi:sensor histidine kinase [Halorarius litoreus]|uniref:sensor histidine kinase n=1 Tax=Halorarius litoreus TaxID=2962676 RepID=UPI0020CF2EF4|nr:HAMP domain-containing sensor histidine kinase [Halorarius litoreus]